MNTPTNTPPSKSKIRLQLDKESLSTRIELGSLLRSFGAPTALAQAAASAWKTDLLIEEDQESGSALYYLSIMLVADFIDLILGQLSADSRAQAMQFRDASRALEASANELSRLKQTKPQAYDAMQQWLKSDEARHLVHKILSGQHQRPPATSQTMLPQEASNSMRATKIKIQDLSIPFLTNSDNERHWPMRLICESMGLNWHAQAAKLQPPRYSPTEHDVAMQGEPLQKRMLCLSQSEFEFWLKSLSSRKVSPAARRRLDQLRTHFFGESAPVAGSTPPTATAAPAVLKRILNWRAQQAEPENRKAMLKEIADQFSAKNGFSIAEAQEHQLRGAVASLSTIIYQHDRSKTPSQMPVSQRVDAIIKSIVDARPQRLHLLDSDFAALLCSIELEGQQRTGIHHEQP